MIKFSSYFICIREYEKARAKVKTKHFVIYENIISFRCVCVCVCLVLEHFLMFNFIIKKLH